MKQVLIIGSGMGGLCLAHYLKKLGIPFSIFERDTSETVRRQGNALGFQGTGVQSLQEALEPELFLEVEKLFPSLLGQVFDMLLADTGSRVIRKPQVKDAFYTVDRTQLRKVLTTGINVQFGKRCVGYESTSEKVIAKFEDGTTVEGSILVGADGVRSVIRNQLLPGINPIPAGYVIIAASLEIDWSLHDEIWGTGDDQLSNAFYCLGKNGTNMFLSSWNPGPDASVRGKKATCNWRIDYSGSEQLPDLNDHAALLAFAKISAERTNIHTRFRKIMDITIPSNMWDAKTVRSMARVQPWKSSRVTLLGDAIHSMTSYGGKGAMEAFADAISLAKLLEKVNKDETGLLNAITEYEAEMISRAFKSVDESLSNTNIMHPKTWVGENVRNWFVFKTQILISIFMNETM
ncbi:hypothetical protein HK096_000766 [Nowakowskiella sp. JEL0078]|nr:hypothetical protein HK096_000766 [Nowakowskiella sp. JEL0078]